MKTNDDHAAAPVPAPQPRTVKLIGIGSAGVALCGALNPDEFAGATFTAIDTDAASLAISRATVKIHLETRLLRGLGTCGDPERGQALAEEQFSTLKAACEGAGVVFIIAGLGGGSGSGVSPVLARAAREAGALVLAFVTLPFSCEGRRLQQADQSFEQLKSIADGVICLPNQKVFKLIDENTGVEEIFRVTGGLLIQGIRGVWQLLTRPGLIQIHFDDMCALIRDRHSESAFAFVEATGPARSREAVEKLLAHPLLDEGRALAEADAILVSLTAGKDLTMAEVNRVMEKINRCCEHAQIIMGAGIDAAMKGKLSVTLIASKNAPAKEGLPVATDDLSAAKSAESGFAKCGHTRNPFAPERREHASHHGARPRRDKSRMLQAQLPLSIVSRGRFDKSEPTIRGGEDLDIPTYVRRGVALV